MQASRLIKLLLVGLLPMLLTACGQQTEDDQGPLSLLVWETYKYKEHQMFLEHIQTFCQRYQRQTGRKVQIISKRVPFDDLETSIRTACLARKTPDIARVDALKVLEFAYHHILVPLDTLPNFKGTISSKARDFMPGPFQTNVVEVHGQTHLYGLPEQTTCLALFWNRRLFRQKEAELRQAGLDPQRAPRTWEELVRYGRILTFGDQYALGLNNSLWWTLPFFGCYQAPFVGQDAQGRKCCLLDDPRAVAALQLKVDLYQKYKIEAGAWKSGGVGPDVGFANEKYAMILMGPWFVEKYRQAGLDFGIALIPKLSRRQAIAAGLLPPNATAQQYQTRITSATNVGGNNMVIFRSCRHPEVAYAFIDYLASCEAQLKWCRALKQIPVNKAAAAILRQDPKTDPDIKIFMEQARYSQPPPRVPRYGYLEADILNPEMELALKNVKTAQQALQDAARKVDRQILSLVNQ